MVSRNILHSPIWKSVSDPLNETIETRNVFFLEIRWAVKYIHSSLLWIEWSQLSSTDTLFSINRNKQSSDHDLLTEFTYLSNLMVSSKTSFQKKKKKKKNYQLIG